MKKSVLIFGHGYAPQFIQNNNQFADVFDRHLFDITMVYLEGEPKQSVIDKHSVDQLIFLNEPLKHRRGLKIRTIKKMITLCRQKKFDMVICHRYKPIYIMLWVSLFCRIPLIIGIMNELHTLRRWTRRLFISLFVRKNLLLAGVSNAVRDDMRKDFPQFPREKMITLYNVVALDKMEAKLVSRASARKQFNITDDDFIFGTIGRLVPAKDQQTLIEAFAMFRKTHKAKLIIIGVGELENQLKKYTQQLGIVDDVIFTGYVIDAFSIIPLFDVFILSSVKEAFGRVLLEAMIGRIPIIATRTHGIPEVVGDDQWIVEPKNANALANTMQMLYQLSPEARAQLGEKNYVRVKTHFSIQQFRELFWSLGQVQYLRTSPPLKKGG